MTSSTNYSDVNVRPRRYRGIRSSKKSILYSDYHPDEEPKNGNLGQRSISLTALPHNGNNSSSATTAPAIPTVTMAVPLLEPRMAQLETLEAKMASIEVSLSTAQRRKNGKKNGSSLGSAISKTQPSGGTPVSIFASIRSNTLIDTCRELEILRNALKDKENTIQNLQGQINYCGKLASLQPLDPAEKRAAELKLQTLKQEEEARKSAIKKINLTLKQMDTKEADIDVRIQQAELEYELGREELELLGVREEIRTLQGRLDAKPTLTLYSSINSSGKYTLHCVQVEYDPKSPRFGAGNVDDKIGLFVLWATENSGLQKGDRILEVNGKLTLGISKEEMIRLLTVCPSKAEIVILRTWAPPSIEDYLRRENLRLTHRISYLEDQVSELLLFKEKPSVPNKMSKFGEKETEIFQKGSHVALLSASTKNGSKSCIISSTNYNNGVSSSSNEMYQNNCHNSNGDNIATQNANNVVVSVNGHHVPVTPMQKYSDNDNHLNYQHKTYGANDKIKCLTKKYEKDELLSSVNRSITQKNGESVEEFQSKKHTTNLLNSRNGFLVENSYSFSDLERPTKKPSHYNCRMIDYSSETNYNRYRCQRDKKTETDEESVNFYRSEQSEAENGRHCRKPTPPKKPIRLSINRTTSLQSVETGYSLQSAVRKIKRSHKGEAPPPPVLRDNKTNDGSQHIDYAKSNLCTPKTEPKQSQTNLLPSGTHWPGNNNNNSINANKNKINEKWY